MAQKFILLDQSSSSTVLQASSYEVQLAEPILLQPGSQVTISDAYVDTGLPAQGGFDIAQDIEVRMRFGYSMHLFDPTTRTTHPHYELCFLQGIDSALYTRVLEFTIPAGTYSPQALAELITTSVVTIPKDFVGVQDENTNAEWYPSTNFRVGNAVFFPSANDEGYAMSMSSGDNTAILQIPLTAENQQSFNFGTNQFAIEFSPDGSGKYAFTFLHRPCLSATTNQPCVLLRRSASNHFYVVSYVSNLLLYNLEPASFWQDMLGFDLNHMCLANRLDVNQNFTLDALLACSTRAYVGVDAFNLTKSPDWNTCVAQSNWPAAGGDPVTILAPQVQYVSAARPPAFNSVGYYLIDLQMLPASSNTIGSETLNATALVNKTFTSEDGFSFYVSSLVQVITSPILVASARVTILNATTREPSTGLGTRNSIIVKLNVT